MKMFKPLIINENITQYLISDNGEIKNIKHETIVKLAEIFNCSPSYLMGWENPTEMSYEGMHQLIARNGKNLTTEEKMELIKLLSELK